MEQAATPLTPHRVIADRVRELRKRHGWSAERLAQEMTQVGVPWERMVVTKLETGRRLTVSVEELFALAYVLSVAPVHLVVPPVNGEDVVPYQHVPAGNPTTAGTARAWIRGYDPIASEARRYFAEVPESEWEPPKWAARDVEAQSDAVRRSHRGERQ